MKINELAELCGVTTETIRKYRERGLLCPERNASNGYYEYSKEDFMNLLFVRKMRGAGVGLEKIGGMASHGGADEIGDMLADEADALSKEILHLQRHLYQLEVMRAHYDLYREHRDEVMLIEAFDVKRDIYFGEHLDSVNRKWIEEIDLFTQVLHVPQKYLEAEDLPDKIPVNFGIGSYEGIIHEYGLPLPDNANIFPLGTYVTAFVSTDTNDYLDRTQLQPMIDYVREHHLKFDTGTTAFLFRIEHVNRKPLFIYRLRAKVSPAT